jgi:hypothetical protein
VIYVTTENNDLYAFDAESAIPVTSGQPLWKRNFGPTGSTGFAVFSTPVIDRATNTLYLVSNSNGTSAVLHALDLSTGNDKASLHSPVTISGSVPGSGDSSVSGTITFATNNPAGGPFVNPNSLYQRPALLLHDGSVYVGFGSNGDAPPYHGWVFGYKADDLSTQTGIYNSTPNANSVIATPGCPGWADWDPAGGAFWMSGAGLAADATGVFATTGNGVADNLQDYGDSVLRLTRPLHNQVLMPVADSFTPPNQSTLDCQDLDFGSSGLALVHSSGPLLVQAAKDGTIYLLNRGSLGTAVQTLPGAIGSPQPDHAVEYGSPAFFKDTVFYKAAKDFVKAFQLTNGLFATSPVATSANNTTGSATPSISSDSSHTSTAIVWTVETGSGDAVLHAYQASNLQELYNSSVVPSDSAGPGIPFPVSAPPTIAAGKVFVGASGQLDVYGGGRAFPLQTGTLDVILHVIPVNPRARFDVAIDGAGQLSRVSNNATTGPLAAAAGVHVVSAAPSLGTMGQYSISFSGACHAGGAVTLYPGNSLTCTVTARLEVCPVGQNWNPVAGMCQRFPSCPSSCKLGCSLSEIDREGPVWRCKSTP